MMNNQILKNVVYNVLSFLTNILITLLLTPFIIKYLGISVYGFVPLALFVSAYIGVITQSITASVNRFLINALQNEDKGLASNIFVSSLLVNFVLVLILLMILFLIRTKVTTIINIPHKNISETISLFQYTSLAVIISFITSSFSVAMYSHNRLDLMQISNIMKNIVKSAIIFLYFINGYCTLRYIGIAIFISEICALLWSVIFFVKLTPFLFRIPRKLDMSHSFKILKLTFWLVLDQIGFILLSKIDLLLLNKNFGASITGKYSIVAQLGDLLKAMASMLGGVLGPVMMILYSRSENEQMVKITKVFSSLISLTLAVPILVICVFSNEIIYLWIGKSFQEASYLAWILLAPMIINLGSIPLFSINIAYNKVKIPSIMNIVFGGVGILIAYILMHFTSLTYLSIPVALTGAITLKNSLFMPIYVASLLGINKKTFFIIHAKTIMFAILFFAPLYIAHENFNLLGINLIIMLSSLCVIGFLISLLFYSKEDIKYIRQIIIRNGRD